MHLLHHHHVHDQVGTEVAWVHALSPQWHALSSYDNLQVSFAIVVWELHVLPNLHPESSGLGEGVQPNENDTSFTNDSVAIPGSALNVSGDQVGVFFSYFTTPILFPLAVANDSNTSDVVDSAVIGATVAVDEGQELVNLKDPVIIKLQSTRIQLNLVSCALLESNLETLIVKQC